MRESRNTIGHGDECVRTAIREQAEKLTCVTLHIATEPRARLHQLLADSLNRSPGGRSLKRLCKSPTLSFNVLLSIGKLCRKRMTRVFHHYV